MRQLKLTARPPELGPLVIRYPLLYRAVALGLVAYGLLMLATDLGRVRGECCSPKYWNHVPAIEFSSLWVAFVGILVVNVYREVVFIGPVVRVSWLGGALRLMSPVEQVTVSEVEVESRNGDKTKVLMLKMRWLTVSISSELDGYGCLRSMIGEGETVET